MDAGTSTARQTRSQYRHELRTLTYVTLDQANGGIVRNLTHGGVGVQAVGALRPQQQLRLRFELRSPRLQVETRGEVMWSTSYGQCGIRFLDLSPRTSRQIQEWIFGNLLEGISLHADRAMFAEPALRLPRPSLTSGLGNPCAEGEDDGLIVSSSPLRVIELPHSPEPALRSFAYDTAEDDSVPLDWLTEPLSASGLTWTINALVVVASLLLFALVFLSVTHEAPPWPVFIAGVFFVPAMYWGFFQMFGGSSLGARLARLASDADDDDEPAAARFR